MALLLAVALTATVADFIGEPGGTIVRAVDGVVSVAAMAWGVRRHASTPRWAWFLLAAGIGVWVVGDALWDSLTYVGAPDASGWYTVANVLYLTTYPALFAATLGLVGGRWRDSLDDVVDSMILAIAAVLLIRLFAVQGSSSASALDTVFNAAYPLADALLLGGVAWLLFKSGLRDGAAWLLTSGTALMLVTDILWDLEIRYDWTAIDPWVGPAYPIAYALIAATAVHPGAARLAQRKAPATGQIHHTRLAMLCLSLAVLGVLTLVDTRNDTLVQVCAVALVVSVALRFAALVRATERAHRHSNENERRFRMLATTVPVGILETDARPHVVFANEESEQLFGASLVGRDVHSLAELISESADDEERSSSTLAVQRVLAGERACAQVRIRNHNGHERWVAWYGTPASDNGRFTGAFVATVDITALKEAESLLSLQATHDALTGLPNRRLLFDRLSRALGRMSRHPGMVGVLFLDLDRFKPVNDRLGHDAGDKLLEIIAGRLQSAVRAEDTVSRVGGDEFALILDGIAGRHDAALVAAKIVDAVAQPIDLDGRPASVDASIGIALSCDPDEDPDTMLRDADAAMYIAKRSGGAQFQFFDDAVGDHELARTLTGKRHQLNLAHRSVLPGP